MSFNFTYIRHDAYYNSNETSRFQAIFVNYIVKKKKKVSGLVRLERSLSYDILSNGSLIYFYNNIYKTVLKSMHKYYYL